MDDKASSSEIRVAALYRFCRLGEPEALRGPLAAFCCSRGIKGTLLLAGEGINGTVAGAPSAIEALVARLEDIPAMAGDVLEPRHQRLDCRGRTRHRAVDAFACEEQ